MLIELKIISSKNQVVKNQRYEEAARLRDSEKKLQEQLEQAKLQWEEDAKTKRFPVTDEDIAEVVAMMTGIPVKRVAQSESKKLVQMNADLTKQVVGQNEAVEKITKAYSKKHSIPYFSQHYKQLSHLNLSQNN